MVGGLPTLLCFVTILVNNLLVYCHVRATIQRGRRRATAEVRMSTKQSSAPDPQVARVRAVATQAFWYVGCFLLTYVPSITLRIMEGQNFDAEDEDTLFPLLVIQTFTFPSQGFFNLLVYVRPSYLRIRREYPDASMFWAFRRAMYGDRVQPTTPHPRGGSLERPSTQFGATNFLQRVRQRMSIARSTRATVSGVSGLQKSQQSSGVGGLSNSQMSTGLPGKPDSHLSAAAACLSHSRQRQSSVDTFHGEESKREVEPTEERDEDLVEGFDQSRAADSNTGEGTACVTDTNDTEGKEEDVSERLIVSEDVYSDED